MEITQEIRAEIDKFKAKGNPVFSLKHAGADYIYIGLLREDLTAIRDAALAESRKLVDSLTEDEKKSPEKQQEVVSKIDEMEESFILSYAILYPKFTHAEIAKLPVGSGKKLRDEIFKASGEFEEPSEPVKL